MTYPQAQLDATKEICPNLPVGAALGEIALRSGIHPMLSVSECIDHLGLSSSEVLLGPGPSAKHEALLASYLLNRWRGPAAVRDLIRSDLKSAVDLGARERAADLLLVLRLYSADMPRLACAELVRMTKSVKTRRHPQLKCLTFEGGARPKFARTRLRRLKSS